MPQLLLTPSEQGIVVFQIWPALPYAVRAAIAITLVLAGLAWQVLALSLLPGIVLVLAGNLFFLVRGYNNNVDFGKFKPGWEWQAATVDKIREIQKLDLRMKTWDRSALDISNRFGFMVFGLVLAVLLGLFFVGWQNEEQALVLVSVNAAVLLLPHWLTGIRTILTRPRLMLKIDAFLKLFDFVKDEVASDRLEFSLLLEGKEPQAIPSDLRFRYVPKGAVAGFLGLQGQMAVNEVQGKSHLYFYVVAVAEQGYGLTGRLADWTPPEGLVLEPSDTGQVEVLVLRQKTTKNSGYSTDAFQIRSIFHYGLILAKRVACGGRE